MHKSPESVDELAYDLFELAEHWAQCEADRTAAESIRDALHTVLGKGWTCGIAQHTGACEAHRPETVRSAG